MLHLGPQANAQRETNSPWLEFEAPHCPSCNREMVKCTARRGGRAGEEFWGCSNYPECRGTRAAL